MVGRNPHIAVYIMANGRNKTLYTGVTSALAARVQQHKLGSFEGFSKAYGCKTLVWYEDHPSMPEAITREKRIKRWRRDWKLALIEAENPLWRDLSDGWFEVEDGPLSWAQRPQLKAWRGWVPGLRRAAHAYARDDGRFGWGGFSPLPTPCGPSQGPLQG